MYSLARRYLFHLDPETAHDRTIRMLAGVQGMHLERLLGAGPGGIPREVMGLTFPNPVGLAAGLDKDGRCIDAFGALGFGFLEVGTVTPRPQPGNPKPRLFRLVEHEGIINRMGFNNGGVDALVERAGKRRYRGILGINIGKNFDTPLEQAHEDYLAALARVYATADYVAVNISSPNTAGLRKLQGPEALGGLLKLLREERDRLAREQNRTVPVAIKIAPDLSAGEIETMGGLLVDHGMDGVIATNTTIGREGVEGHARAGEQGGLSGIPVRDRSTEVIRRLAEVLQGRLPIIGAGGIFHPDDAREKFDAGASLIQIYTGFIYRGPPLVRALVAAG